MPRGSNPTARPEAGTLDSYILWHTSRGMSSSDLYSRAKEKFGGRNWQSIKSTMNYYQTIYEAGDRVSRYKGNAYLSQSSIPAHTTNPTGLRAYVEIDWDQIGRKPRGMRQRRQYTVDIGMVRQKADLVAAIKLALLRDISSQYEGRNIDIGKRMGSIRIKGLEGI